MPEGSFEADPGSNLGLPVGIGGAGYDAPLKTWIPVYRRWLAPKGDTYVYTVFRTGNEIHAVDVRTRSDHLLAEPARLWWPVGVDDGAAYAAGDVNTRAGLWRLPFDGGPAETVGATGYWMYVRLGAAWGTATRSLPAGAPWVLKRLDLKTGRVTEWFSVQPGGQIIGFGALGLPIVQVNLDVYEVTGEGRPRKIAEGFRSASIESRETFWNLAEYLASGDAHGVWLAGRDGIYFARGGALIKVTSISTYPAGDCF